MKTVAIWSGAGTLPYFTAKNAILAGNRVVIIAFDGLSDVKLLETTGAKIYKVGLLKLGKNFQILKKERVNELVMIGKFYKRALFYGGFDITGLKLFFNLPDLRDMTLFKTLESKLKDMGIKVVSQIKYLNDFIAKEGVLTYRKPSSLEMKDILYGFKVAKKLASLDIGQTVVVKKGCVVALEAMEGTDETILRINKKESKDAVIVKVARKNQDFRFDLPGIGITTIENMHKKGIKTIAVEKDKCLLADKDELIKRANKYKLTVIGIKGENR